MAERARKNPALSTAEEYLRRPYARTVVPEDDGSYRAEILEFPGCIAAGETEEEALAYLRDVAESWLEAAIELGQPIPEPMECNDYSGKTVLRMPKSLHRKAAYAAERDGVSLNQFIVSSLSHAIGERAASAANAPPPAQIYVLTGPMYGIPTQIQTTTNGISRKSTRLQGFAHHNA